MDTSFEVDKVFYQFGSVDDLKDFWDSDLDTQMTDDDVLTKLNSNNENMGWTCIEGNGYPGVILQDKLMTDAALLGNRPIKTEHSYSLTSDGNSLPPESPLSYDKLEDMEDDYYPTVHMENSCEENSFEIKKESAEIKHEFNENDDSITSSSPSSPKSDFNGFQMNVDMSQIAQAFLKQSSGQKVILTTPRTTIIPQNKVPIPKIKVKIGNGTFSFPPTPPSCSSSDDSEDNAMNSQPSSPAARKTSRPALPPVYHSSATRHPIHTPLISSQPKGSTGILILTDEEKKTLIAEGYPVPTRLPLTKAEEKSLKKIRRKIKNKISAQESRRKKKEYMDQLEKKVEILVNENNDYKSKIENLEEVNSGLMNRLEKLQAVIQRTYPDIYNLVIKQINK